MRGINITQTLGQNQKSVVELFVAYVSDPSVYMLHISQ